MLASRFVALQRNGAASAIARMAARGPFHCATSAGAQVSTTPASKSREWPDEPRVGVGVVVFRRPVPAGEVPEILLIRRAKEPAKGEWCFPGGSMELGEGIAACAVREVMEETGVPLRCTLPHTLWRDSSSSSSSSGRGSSPASTSGRQGAAEAPAGRVSEEGYFSRSLATPTAFAAVDSIVRDETSGGDPERVRFHYAILEVAAMAADPEVEPVASDDVDDVAWVRTDQLRQLPNLTRGCAKVVEEALHRFDLTS